LLLSFAEAKESRSCYDAQARPTVHSRLNDSVGRLDFPACRQAGLLLFLSRKKVREPISRQRKEHVW
jgi:hypothetical protein